jgi:putative molybdopterin biosynthesis protein
MSPASSGQPRPAAAYALWLDSLTRAGWEAGPAAEQVPAGSALGRVSAEPIVARWPSPRSDCSAMDGIAVRAAGLTAAAAAATAVDGSAVRLPAGTFEWIDTGDPMPAGADTVVMREWLLPQEDGGVIIVPGGLTAAAADATGIAVPLGKNVRTAGEDFAAGTELVPPGRRLRPGDLAAAAAGGHVMVVVARPPVVAIIPTGDEIRPPGSTARPGEILDTNSLMLAARCRQLSAIPALSEIQPDDPDALAAEIRRCAHEADLVLVIAGSSRGRGDHAGAVLAQVGGVAVTGVAVRPGHPALLGHAKHPGSPARSAASGRAGIAPVIGLPGYPLASTVIFELFAAPLLDAIQGVRPAPRPALLAALDRDWSSPPGLEDWVLVTLAPPAASPAGRALPVATPARRGAGSISQLARADAWWPIPPDRTAFCAGAPIELRAIPNAPCLLPQSGVAAGDTRMVPPGGHGRQVAERLALELLAAGGRVTSRLPRDHPLESLVERLQLARFVGAVDAVPAGLDRHAAALTGLGRRGGHRRCLLLVRVVPGRDRAGRPPGRGPAARL